MRSGVGGLLSSHLILIYRLFILEGNENSCLIPTSFVIHQIKSNRNPYVCRIKHLTLQEYINICFILLYNTNSLGFESLSNLMITGPTVIERLDKPWYQLTCSFSHTQQELAELDIKVNTFSVIKQL